MYLIAYNSLDIFIISKQYLFFCLTLSYITQKIMSSSYSLCNRSVFCLIYMVLCVFVN
nr:MAG TPA: hypothetical protein [Bacteriophage sp.]